MRSPWIKAATVAIAALALAACGEKTGGTGAEAGGGSEAAAFLEKNAKAEGVRTTPSGLQYKIVLTGPPVRGRPGKEDLVKVHYEGALTDGTVFDSSYERGQPAVFDGLTGLIPAWEEAIPMMTPGDSWILYVPPALGYGEQGSGPIPPNSVLVFKIELLDYLPRGDTAGRG